MARNVSTRSASHLRGVRSGSPIGSRSPQRRSRPRPRRTPTHGAGATPRRDTGTRPASDGGARSRYGHPSRRSPKLTTRLDHATELAPPRIPNWEPRVNVDVVRPTRDGARQATESPLPRTRPRSSTRIGGRRQATKPRLHDDGRPGLPVRRRSSPWRPSSSSLHHSTTATTAPRPHRPRWPSLLGSDVPRCTAGTPTAGRQRPTPHDLRAVATRLTQRHSPPPPRWRP